jgi:hypothetical protein
MVRAGSFSAASLSWWLEGVGRFKRSPQIGAPEVVEANHRILRLFSLVWPCRGESGQNRNGRLDHPDRTRATGRQAHET